MTTPVFLTSPWLYVSGLSRQQPAHLTLGSSRADLALISELHNLYYVLQGVLRREGGHGGESSWLSAKRKDFIRCPSANELQVPPDC